MAPRDPFNITILDPDEYIERKGCLPVTVHSMYEPSTSRFHPDGLFSEVIFGQVGTPERLTKRGYIDLHTTIITPHLFKQLITLKGYYKDVLAGREYAVFDEELQDFVKVEKAHPEGQTGYSFFINNLPKVAFKETDSIKRHDKIQLLEKFADRLLITKYIVIPAGIRDVKEKNGRTTSEDINKLYLSLLSLTQAMPAMGSDDVVFDSIRYQIQMKVQQIYTYLTEMLDGKGGYSQSKYAARSIVWANRNVITAAPVSRATEPEAINSFKADEVLVPLFQSMKAASPLIINKLKSLFFDVIFTAQSTQAALIDPKTLKLEYYELPVSEIRRFTTSDGLSDMINEFRDLHTHAEPVVVSVQNGNKKESKYLQLVYDNGDFVYYLRNLDDFKEMYAHKDRWSIDNVKFLDTVPTEVRSHIVLVGAAACRAYGYERTNQELEIIPESEEYVTIGEGSVTLANWKEYMAEKAASFKEFTSKYCNHIGDTWVLQPEYLLELHKKSNRPADQGKIKYLEMITFDQNKIRPLTNIEMFYCAAYTALKDRCCTVTRHPVLNIEGIVPYHIHLVSTSPSRVVTMKVHGDESLARDVVLPEYPILGEKAKTSMSMHPTTLEKYDGK